MSPTTQTLDVVALPRMNTRIAGGYTLLQELGRGSFGVVYEAEQELLRRRVAIKMLRPEVVLLPGIAERFLREAQLASALSHENTATIYSVGIHAPYPDAQGLPFIAMERLHGESLHEHLEREGALSLPDTATILLPILDALTEAHKLGIIHRDLKPENIWLDQRSGRTVVKVLDFGIAKAIGQDWSDEIRQPITLADHPFGTPAFMPPEQATTAHEVTPAADLYAVGCVAYLMLTGRLPYTGSSAAHVLVGHLSPSLPPMPADLLSEPLADLLCCAMAKRPEDRFQSADEMAQALRAVLALETPGLHRTHAADSGDLPVLRSTGPHMSALQSSPHARLSRETPAQTRRPTLLKPMQHTATQPVEPPPTQVLRSVEAPADELDAAPPQRGGRALLLGASISAALMILSACLLVWVMH